MKHALAGSLALCVAIAACGSSDQKDIFGGNPGGSAGAGGAAGTSSGGSGGGATGGGSGVGGGSGGASGSGGAGAVGGSAGIGGSAGGSGVGGSAGLGGSAGGSGVGGSAAVGGSAGVGGDGGVGGNGGVGGAPPGVCTGQCGSSEAQQGPSGPCYCDAQCLQQNDCCADFEKSCGNAGPGLVGCFDAGACSLSQGFCCMDFNDGSCVPHGSSCFNDASIWCDGPEDCGSGQICCGNLQQGRSGVFWTDFSCQTPGQCAGSNEYEICGSDPSVCAPGLTCNKSASMPQIRFCGQP